MKRRGTGSDKKLARRWGVNGRKALRCGLLAIGLHVTLTGAVEVEEDPLPAAFSLLRKALDDAEQSVRESPAYGNDQERASGYLHLSRMLLKAIEQEMLQDAAFPFFRVLDMHVREGGDNPDQRYLFAPVEGGRAYRIHGTLGSASRIEVQLYAGEPWGGSGRSAGYLPFESISVDEDGEFAVDLLPQHEAARSGALVNPADSTTVVVRQIYADWADAAPGHIHIDRVGREGDLRPAESSAHVAARLRETARIFAQSTAIWPEFVEKRYRQVRSANELSKPLDTASLGGVAGRWMVSGHFDLPEGQVLLIESRPTRARYQALQITDLWFASLEYANGTSSYTRSQSVLADDGAYYHVVAAADPGYPNWLSTGGLRRGTLLLRYDGVEGSLPESQWPSARLVAAEDLPDEIPGFHALTAEQRGAQLRERRKHIQRRFSR